MKETKSNLDIVNMVKRTTEPIRVATCGSNYVVEEFSPETLVGGDNTLGGDDLINLQIPLNKRNTPATPFYNDTIRD